MPKYIAHSSIDENGKAHGGEAGDQTKREVCIRTWYSGKWDAILRIENEEVRNQFGNNMIDIAKNDKIGYDQYQRNTLLKEALKTNFNFSAIETACECDCSSAVVTALLGAIYKVFGKEAYEKAYENLVSGSNCATTRTLKTRMKSLSEVNVSVYTSKAYTESTEKARFGDVYLRTGHHVVVYIDDGKKREENRNQYYETYTGKSGSIVDALNAIGVDSSKANRSQIAKTNGIENYFGTAKQNTEMLDLLKNGKLKK